MRHYKKIFRHTFTGIAFCCALAAGGGGLNKALAQEATGEISRPRNVGRDPFVKYKPPARPRRNPAAAPVPITPPGIQDRIKAYKAQKAAAMNAQLGAPKPTTALLLSEMQVIGIFRTPRGYAAMVEAAPIKLSYVIYPGEMFYDGQLVAIEEDRLVFRRETRWTNGRREVSVENKSLRQANAVRDAMTSSKDAPAPAAASPTTGSANNRATTIAKPVEP